MRTSSARDVDRRRARRLEHPQRAVGLGDHLAAVLDPHRRGRRARSAAGAGSPRRTPSGARSALTRSRRSPRPRPGRRRAAARRRSPSARGGRPRSPDLEHEVGEAVDHRRRLVEARRALDQPERLDPAGDPVELAELGSQRGEDREPGQARRLVALLERRARRRPGRGPATSEPSTGQVAGDVAEAAADLDQVERELDPGRGRERLRQLEPELARVCRRSVPSPTQPSLQPDERASGRESRSSRSSRRGRWAAASAVSRERCAPRHCAAARARAVSSVR